MSESDIVCVATTPNRELAHVWRGALEAEGIECQVGEQRTFLFDNTPWAQSDVWVHRALALSHPHRLPHPFHPPRSSAVRRSPSAGLGRASVEPAAGVDVNGKPPRQVGLIHAVGLR